MFCISVFTIVAVYNIMYNIMVHILGPRRSIIVPDRRLPPGWEKHFTQRKAGTSAGKWDVLFIQ